MEDLVICDKCDCEFPAHESMPDPETDLGDYCFECYVDMEYEWDVKRGTAWLKVHLPSLEDFMKGYKRIAKGTLNPRSMENNCHAAANTLVQLVKDKMKIKPQRGHWTGGDVRSAGRVMQQHSWTQVSVPDNNIQFVVDPTQWVFTGAEPSLCISTEDDTRYDIGGYHVKEAILGKKVIPERNGPTVKSNLNKEARDWLKKQADRDWSVWTIEEQFVLANMDPRAMLCAKDIFKAIIDGGNKGLIPLEGLELAGL
jgi:hypothetical protein